MIFVAGVLLSMVLLCESQTVETQYGPILGRSLFSALGRNYFSFQKIPYMKAPIGKLRFRRAEIPENWGPEPLDCTVQGPRFPQIDFTFESARDAFAGELDSMHINVYTNNFQPSTPYPVLVWIHGGGFRTGSALTDIYGPDYFMEQDVVVVTFNYRLHAFGFLSLDDRTLEIPGNAGMKDQVLALKWIKENIANFGGDANNITIFGQSSGGGCAHYHILSDASKDLFQRSIIMSGSAFNNMYSAVPRRNWAFRLASSLNYTGPNVDRLVLEFLEGEEPQRIFTAVGNLLTPEEREVERLLNAFGPTIEPYRLDDAFMLEHPEKLAVNSWGNNVDIMIGATSLENGALIPVISFVPGALESFLDFSTFVPASLDLSEEQRKGFGRDLRSTYYGLMEPSRTNVDGIVIMSGEFAFWHSIHRVVKQRWASRGSGRSFVYRFDVNSDNNCFSRRNNVPMLYREPVHMDDICHLFKTSFANVPNVTSVGWNTMQQMVGIFTRFAATGNPGVQNWLPSTGSGNSPPLVGYNLREVGEFIGSLPEVDRMEVWDSFYSASNTLKSLNVLIFILIVIKLIV